MHFGVYVVTPARTILRLYSEFCWEHFRAHAQHVHSTTHAHCFASVLRLPSFESNTESFAVFTQDTFTWGKLTFLMYFVTVSIACEMKFTSRKCWILWAQQLNWWTVNARLICRLFKSFTHSAGKVHKEIFVTLVFVELFTWHFFKLAAIAVLMRLITCGIGLILSITSF